MVDRKINMVDVLIITVTEIEIESVLNCVQESGYAATGKSKVS